MLDMLESRKGQQLIIILFIYFSFADFQDGGSCTDISGDFGCGMCNDEASCLAESQQKVQWTFQPYPKQKIFSINHTKPAGLPSSNLMCSFWVDSSLDASPLVHEGSTGLLTTDADVCIIGWGITGVSVAYHLSQAVKMTFLRQGTFLQCPLYFQHWMINKVVSDLLSGAGATGELIYQS